MGGRVSYLAAATVSLRISDGDHGFFCNQRPSYNARAAAEAWALTLTFLRGR
jgi:carboxymethylenebutenolidase